MLAATHPGVGQHDRLTVRKLFEVANRSRSFEVEVEIVVLTERKRGAQGESRLIADPTSRVVERGPRNVAIDTTKANPLVQLRRNHNISNTHASSVGSDAIILRRRLRCERIRAEESVWRLNAPRRGKNRGEVAYK